MVCYLPLYVDGLPMVLLINFSFVDTALDPALWLSVSMQHVGINYWYVDGD